MAEPRDQCVPMKPSPQPARDRSRGARQGTCMCQGGVLPGASAALAAGQIPPHRSRGSDAFLFSPGVKRAPTLVSSAGAPASSRGSATGPPPPEGLPSCTVTLGISISTLHSGTHSDLSTQAGSVQEGADRRAAGRQRQGRSGGKSCQAPDTPRQGPHCSLLSG